MNINELLDTIEDALEESANMPLSGGMRSGPTCPANCGRPRPL